MNNSALLVLSGGQDSTTCLFWAMKRFKQVLAVGFDYGQRHKFELECAEAICKKFNIPFEIIKTPVINELSPSSLTRADIEVEKEIPAGSLPNSLVEGRNLLFLSFAAIYAKTRRIGDIVTGVSETDFSGYPDCRDEFIKSLNAALNLAMDYRFTIHTPLMRFTKAQTWKLAQDLGVLKIIYEDTLTCYNGIKGGGCGCCPACFLRAKGYQEFLNGEKGNV